MFLFCLEIVNFLLDKGAVFNIQDRDGHLPLDLAEQRGHQGNHQINQNGVKLLKCRKKLNAFT